MTDDTHRAPAASVPGRGLSEKHTRWLDTHGDLLPSMALEIITTLLAQRSEVETLAKKWHAESADEQLTSTQRAYLAALSNHLLNVLALSPPPRAQPPSMQHCEHGRRYDEICGPCSVTVAEQRKAEGGGICHPELRTRESVQQILATAKRPCRTCHQLVGPDETHTCRAQPDEVCKGVERRCTCTVQPIHPPKGMKHEPCCDLNDPREHCAHAGAYAALLAEREEWTRPGREETSRLRNVCRGKEEEITHFRTERDSALAEVARLTALLASGRD